MRSRQGCELLLRLLRESGCERQQLDLVHDLRRAVPEQHDGEAELSTELTRSLLRCLADALDLQVLLK